MASKKYLELQELQDADLKAELEAAQGDFQKMKFDHAVAGLDNPLTLRELRRDIARLQTEVRRRELAVMSEDALAQRSKIRARRKKA